MPSLRKIVLDVEVILKADMFTNLKSDANTVLRALLLLLKTLKQFVLFQWLVINSRIGYFKSCGRKIDFYNSIFGRVAIGVGNEVTKKYVH